MKIAIEVVLALMIGALMIGAPGGTPVYFTQVGHTGQYLGHVEGAEFVTCAGTRIKLADFKAVALKPATVSCSSIASTSSGLDADGETEEAKAMRREKEEFAKRRQFEN